MIDTQRMDAQEKKDFGITAQIMQRIFKQYGANVKIAQTEPYCAVDAMMDVEAPSGNTYKYAVEIKERNVPSVEEAKMPLKVKKYINIKAYAEANEAKPIVVYLINGEQYAIFNLNSISLDATELANWRIQEVNFTAPTQKVKYDEVPTLFFTRQQAAITGKI